MPSAEVKLPPFAKPLLAKRAQGLMPVDDLFIADGWDLGRDSDWWPWRIVVPEDANPLLIDFGVCRGLSCIVGAYNMERATRICANVLAFWPKRLKCFDMTTSQMLTVFDENA